MLLLAATLFSCTTDDEPDGVSPTLVDDNFSEGAMLRYDTTEFLLRLRFSEPMVGVAAAVQLEGDAEVGEVLSPDGLAWTVAVAGLGPGREVTLVVAGATGEDGDLLDPPVRGTIRVDRAPVEPTDLNLASGCEGADIELRWTGEAGYGTHLVEIDLGSGWVTTGISAVEADRATLRVDTAGTFPWQVTHQTESGGSASATSVVTVGVPALPVSVAWPTRVYDSFSAVPFAVEPDPGGPSYVWSTPPGATVVAGDGSASIEVDFAGATSGAMSVVAVNDCGDSLPRAAPVEVLSDVPVVFPDAALETCVREAAGIDAPAPLLVSALVELTALTCQAADLVDLSGLEHLEGLTALALGGDALTDLSPLAGLDALTNLVVTGTAVADLGPLAGLTSLEYLVLISNAITDLGPLAELTNLETLGLQNNSISDLRPLSSLGALRILDLGNNAISDLTGLESLTSLEHLGLPGNPLADLGPLAALTDLRDLDLQSCGLVDLGPLASMTGLEQLSLNGNEIADLGPLAPLTGLTVLHLSVNQITDLGPLDGLTALTELRVSGNAVTDVTPLAALTALTWLSLDDNAVEDPSPLGALTSLTMLELQNNAVTDLDGLGTLTSLQTLRAADNAIADISSLSTLPALWQLHLSNNQVVDVSALSSVTILRIANLDHNLVIDVAPLSDLDALEILDLSANQVTDLADFAAGFDCTDQPTLSFSQNPLDAADCADLVALENAGCQVSFDLALGC